jgi:CRP-like cAMP-binding protein
MENGAAVEIVATGREGMAGVQAILTADAFSDRMIAQIPGHAYCMSMAAFQGHLTRLPQFRKILFEYGLRILDALSQSIACNRLHHVNERCAKWLLLTHDRVASDQFPMTHEFLSMMLGVNRPTVTIAASTLQQAGLITYSRGTVTIQNRKGLEKATCECYSATDNGLGPTGGA